MLKTIALAGATAVLVIGSIAVAQTNPNGANMNNNPNVNQQPATPDNNYNNGPGTAGNNAANQAGTGGAPAAGQYGNNASYTGAGERG